MIPVEILLRGLRATYPDAKYALDWETPLQLLVATILAAQCTDERVNRVTKTLFPKYATAADYAGADTEELEAIIRPTGTYRNKAKSIQGACRKLVEEFGGEVPRDIAALITLPGIQRKSANVILNTAWNIASGIIVDTHVNRLAERMGLSTQKTPDKKEPDLMRLIPQDQWTFFGPAMILHGRATCTAREPRCAYCVFDAACPKLGLENVDAISEPTDE